ncbi:MAG: hypothetical protein APF81_18185 [Desulfosporosinus sp. BRH_c37]|nr:MAG: hypothetical protein APF81_18185 [Desulfosporosinus sp. BRH_c37]
MTKNLFGIFEESDIERLVTLISKLEESSFDFLKLEGEDIKIVIGKNGMSDVIEICQTKVEAPSKGNGEYAAKPQSEDENGKNNITDEKETISNFNQGEDIQEQEGTVFIKAPTAGLFYAQPEPGAPLYVKVGDKVNKDTTVALLEIMKVYNAIAAGVSGEITKIHVQDMELVEAEQPLFSVKLI